MAKSKLLRLPCMQFSSTGIMAVLTRQRPSTEIETASPIQWHGYQNGNHLTQTSQYSLTYTHSRARTHSMELLQSPSIFPTQLRRKEVVGGRMRHDQGENVMLEDVLTSPLLTLTTYTNNIDPTLSSKTKC